MMIEASMLVVKLVARRALSCHCECRSMMSPMGPVLLRRRRLLRGPLGETTAVWGWLQLSLLL